MNTADGVGRFGLRLRHPIYSFIYRLGLVDLPNDKRERKAVQTNELLTTTRGELAQTRTFAENLKRAQLIREVNDAIPQIEHDPSNNFTEFLAERALELLESGEQPRFNTIFFANESAISLSGKHQDGFPLSGFLFPTELFPCLVQVTYAKQRGAFADFVAYEQRGDSILLKFPMSELYGLHTDISCLGAGNPMPSGIG